MKLRLVTKATMPFSSTRSDAQRKKPSIHIVKLRFLRRRGLDVCCLNAPIYLRVFAVLIILVLIELIGVVRWIADNNTDLFLILSIDARNVFLAQATEKIPEVLTFLSLERRRV